MTVSQPLRRRRGTQIAIARAECAARYALNGASRTKLHIHAMPMSGAGTILKRELRKRFWSDDPSQVS